MGSSTALAEQAETTFRQALKSRSRDYFARSGLNPRSDPRLHAKALATLAWAAGSYAFLVFAASSPLEAVAGSLSLGLAAAAVGFNIQHDANHGAFSERPWVNRAWGFTLDLLGASSYVWRARHNAMHHGPTNLTGEDVDLDAVVPMARYSPHHPWKPVHAFQHVYLWPLYALFIVQWHLTLDWHALLTGKIVHTPMRRPDRGELALLFTGKALFIGWAFVLPSFFHSAGHIAACYFIAALVTGLVSCVVLSIGHISDRTYFPSEGGVAKEPDWMAHQLRSTVNFAMDGVLARFYLGGLNFHIEHHLFPTVAHVHYPALSKVVQETCREFGLPYEALPSTWAAIASPQRQLRMLGQRPVGKAQAA